MESSKDLTGKVALVTGGSSGIGAAAVRMLADAGARLVIGYHSGEERARELMAGLPGADHRAAKISLEDTATIRSVADELKATHGRIDVLVNSAGFTTPIPHRNLDALDDALFDRILIANARGPYSVIRALLPLLTASNDAVIVNVSSISAFTGSGSNIAYCGAKAALDTMGMSLARVLGPTIRVLSVSPAAVATDFVAGRGRDALEKGAEATPLRRVVEPEDVARAIMACVTHLKTATGTRIVVDGGRHL
jgi:3-oxoacyl-[acyl-carrier protein] reductase